MTKRMNNHHDDVHGDDDDDHGDGDEDDNGHDNYHCSILCVTNAAS